MNLISGIGLIIPFMWYLSFGLGLLLGGGGGDDTSDGQLVFAVVLSSILTGCCVKFLCNLIQTRPLLWMPKATDLSSWRSAHGFLFVPAIYWPNIFFGVGLLTSLLFVLRLI